MLVFSLCGGAAAQDAGYAEELVAQALARGLDRHPTWLNLVHYQPALWGSQRSLVDDPRFFNASNGKSDPQAELAATLSAFFLPPGTNELEHAVCRFVARFDWLRQELGIDTKRLPVGTCAKYDAISRYLNVSAVTLAYPAAYMNGPASMFGHTLLVFDDPSRNRLLSRAVSYAAKTDQRIGPLFAFAGIAGLYPGYYAIQPYYEKTEQYGDIGHRDVWEYVLDFGPAEVDRMLRHAWELQSIWSRYYFFGENCAYNLYYFLDVARPPLALHARRDWFVIPIDTVKAVAKAGLVKDVQYRPSAVTKIRHLAAGLPVAEQRLALDVAKGRRPAEAVTNSVADATNRIAVLDLAAGYIQYLYTEEQIAVSNYTPRLLETLRVRSKLGAAPPELTTIPVPPRPDLGHGPVRWSAGGGVAEGEGFASLQGRIAYHGLADNCTGYDPGAAIEFGRTDLRYMPADDEVRFERFDVVDVISMAPRDMFFQPGSWKFGAGVMQAHRDEDEDALVLQAHTGAGLTRRVGGRGLAAIWIEAHGLAGTELGGADYAGGGGPAVSLVRPLGERLMQVLEARAVFFAAGEAFWDFQGELTHDWRLRADRSVALDLAGGARDGEERTEARLRVNAYF